MSVTISEATHKALSGYPYLKEYLALGIVNNRALARSLLDEVKKDLGGDVNLQSVVTAVRRFPVSKARSGKDRISSILSKSEVNLKYDVGVLTMGLDSEVLERMEELQATVRNPHMLLQGIETLTIVVEEKQLEGLREIFGKKVLDLKKDLAFIVVKSPRDIVETHGVIAYLGNILALEGINVVEMMSSHTETCFIVDEGDALKTVEAIRREIKRAR
ncbi:MAG: hypothetical protein V3T58_03930 [Candidatus Hydrothermarchaeales archaeon]